MVYHHFCDHMYQTVAILTEIWEAHFNREFDM